MAKNNLDKYYTPPTIAKWCIERTYEVIGKENITEIVENSAGCGTFSRQIPDCKAYDLVPQGYGILKADYLNTTFEYKKGRLFIGNPPFGRANNLLKNFYKKQCTEGDYIAWIIPLTYYKFQGSLNRFELIDSHIIKTKYTNHDVSTCFNIYKRNPDQDKFLDAPEEIQDYTLYRYNKTRNQSDNTNCDIYFSKWGNFKVIKRPFDRAASYGVIIHNEKIRTRLIHFIHALEWMRKNEQINFCGVAGLTEAYFYHLAKKFIPELQ